ncbi:major facilitator superfamily domain-containing protein [Tricharina praecox]|uniref:major facilitator superfamily domain-containing protein n=1 Tax=Tricharina praecox TaxID=43433 RepID=UPI0022205693|nr:major facilitator superfamily domain-containing protein [Tricharina praecox]KAI5843276.1 major facilitator superfamily domain-containing protein [Tricharina praecox]
MAPTDPERGPQPQAGVLKAQAISRTWTRRSLWIAYAGMFLMCISTSLDQQTTNNLVSFATSSFNSHSLLSTVAVITNILNAVMQPPIAKFSDVFGRTEAFTLAITLYILGAALTASSGSIAAYTLAKVFDAAGNTSLRMLQQVFIADTSDLLNRALMSSLPDVPFLATVWLGPVIGGPLATRGAWRWAYGMWALITPVCSAPLFWCLWASERKARRAGARITYPWRGGGCWAGARRLATELDVGGMLLLTAGFALLLAPLTLRQGGSGWNQPGIIACFVIGGVALLLFPVWESRAPHPIVPLELFKNRTVVAGCTLGLFYFAAFFLSVQPYFFSYLVVARDHGPVAAGHIVHIFSFACTVAVLGAGAVIKRVGEYKRILLVGVAAYTTGIGLMLRFRTREASTAAVVIVQVLVGVGGGLINVPTQLGIQASVGSGDVACATAVFLTTVSLGGAVGSAVSGAVWSRLLHAKLVAYLPEESMGMLENIFGDFTVAKAFPMGGETRVAIGRAYDETMRTLLIIALCVCAPLWPMALCMKSLKLRDVETEEKGVIIGGGRKVEVEDEGQQEVEDEGQPEGGNELDERKA